MKELPRLMKLTNKVAIMEQPHPDAECGWCGDTGRFLDTEGNDWSCLNGCEDERTQLWKEYAIYLREVIRRGNTLPDDYGFDQFHADLAAQEEVSADKIRRALIRDMVAGESGD